MKCLPSNHHSTRRTIGFMHQLITRSDTSISAVSTHVGYGVRCRVTSGYDWTDICQPWGEGERPVLLQCLAVSADASSNQTCRRTLFIHKTICCLRRNWSFLCSMISQGKVVALDIWGGKWNHLSMTHRLINNYAKNYCNRTLFVKVIVENVVTFFGTQCIRWCGDSVLVRWTIGQFYSELIATKSSSNRLKVIYRVI